MQIYWFDKENIPENADPYDQRKLLRFDHSTSTTGAIVLGNPKGDYTLRPFSPKKKWIELYTEHHFNELEAQSWCNDRVKGPVGLISGFGPDIGLKIALASVVNEDQLPQGARNASVLFINGPNLNILGTREPELYGTDSLETIFTKIRGRHPELDIEAIQTNAEDEIIEQIHEARDQKDAIIINAGAFTHTSIAIHDALKCFNDVIIELHVTNPHQRETFRHRSFVAPTSHGMISGFGGRGYELALMGAMSKL